MVKEQELARYCIKKTHTTVSCTMLPINLGTLTLHFMYFARQFSPSPVGARHLAVADQVA